MNHWMLRSGLERTAVTPDAVALDAAWQGAFVLPVDPEGRFTGGGGTPLPVGEPGPRRRSDILLGVHDGRTWFARPVPEVEEDRASTWRDVATQWQEPVAAAVALVRWHAMAPHCERCGGRTEPEAAGSRRLCTECGLLAFPRQDPAVIVAVLDPRDRILLASHRSWPPERVSVIAGFVEAGESLEQACWREVAEEVGVALENVTYVSSQPWPMPRSLMLGFVGRTARDVVEPDGEEIAWGRFWTREELTAALASEQIRLPGPASIARDLIERWRAGTLSPDGVVVTNA